MDDEKKYIEQGAALDAVFGQFCASSDETERALNAAIEEIKAISAADVAPVRHGRWTAEDRCSACGEEPLTDFDVTLMRFCPYCGAKMDGGDTNG